MSDEGKIASRIFSKHLVIHDEFENDEDQDSEETREEKDKVEGKVENKAENKIEEKAEEKVENKIEDKVENDIPEIGDLSEEFTHAATVGGNPEEIKIEGDNEKVEGDEKMEGENRTEDIIKAEEEESSQSQSENINFDDDEGETLVLNFQIPQVQPGDQEESSDSSDSGNVGLDDLFMEAETEEKKPEPVKIEESDETIFGQEPFKFEEPQETAKPEETQEPLFSPQLVNPEEPHETPELQPIGFEEPQEIEIPQVPLSFEEPQETETPQQSFNFEEHEETEPPQELNSFEEPQEIALSNEVETVSSNNEPELIEIPEFEDAQSEEFPQEISLFQNTETEETKQPENDEPMDFESQPSEGSDEIEVNEDDSEEGEESKEQIDDDSIIDDSQGRIIEEKIVEEPEENENKTFEKDLTEEEKEINSLTSEFPQLQDMSSEIKEFLINNIDILTKERLSVCLDSDLPLEDIKGFFVGTLSEGHRERVYAKLRKIEMQYIFENFIQCFNIERFTRKKEAIDGKIVTNIVVLRDDIFIDGYESLNTAKDIDVKSGESSFILSDELEIKVEDYIEEIKAAKLNAENVYLMILDGAIVDDDAVKLATRYGVKIVDMDIPISSVNRNLEEIKKGIIV